MVEDFFVEGGGLEIVSMEVLRMEVEVMVKAYQFH